MRKTIKTKSLIALAALASAFAVTSCQNDELRDFNVESGTENYIIADFASTRTANAGDATEWASGDAISVINTPAGEASYTAKKYSYVGSGNEFKGYVSHLADNNDWFLFYPYSADIKDPSAVKFSIASTQTQQGNSSTAHLCGSNFPLYGKSLNLPKTEQMHIAMSNIDAAIAFDLTNTEDYEIIVKEITFTALSDLSGDFVADLTKQSFEFKSNGNNSKSVTLTVANGAKLGKSAAASFYVGVVPFVAPAGSKLEVTVKAVKASDASDASASVEYRHTYTVNAETAFASGTRPHLSVSFEDSSEEPVPTVKGYSLITAEPSDWSGKYIMVSYDKKYVFTGDNGTSNKYELKSSDLTGEIITKDCSAYEFEIEKSGTSYYLKHNSQYLDCSYSGTGSNSTTGMRYSSTTNSVTLTVENNGSFRFTDSSQAIYYKSGGYFGFGGSHGGNCVYLYKYTENGDPGSDTPDTPDTPTTGDKYVRITSAPADWSGTYLFVDESSSKAFAAFSDVSNYAVSVTLNGDGTITAGSSVDKYALTVTATGQTHTNVSQPSYNVQNSDGKYIFYSENAIQISDTDYRNKPDYGGDVTYNHCFSYQSGAVQVLSSGNYSNFTKYYLRYSSSRFSYSSTESHKIQLYKLDGEVTPGKQNQNLSFANTSVSWTLGNGYSINGQYQVQAVSNLKTSVSYTSSNTSVATISGTQLTIKGAGSTTITATAAATDDYYSATATYTLNIYNQDVAGFTDLGTFNLENAALKEYLTDADSKYTDDNTTSVMGTYYSKTYTNLGSPRKDCPAPVKVTWTNSGSSSSKTVTVYSDQDLKNAVITQVVSGSSTTSTEIYNLIPGRTYYCTVTGGSSVIFKGVFRTEGRRRMIKVSDTQSQDRANNCRDLGGIKTLDGKTIKYGIVYRGSNMDQTTADEKKLIAEFMNVASDVDYRGSSSGSQNRKDVFKGTSYDVTWYNSNNNSISFNGTSDAQVARATFNGILDAARKGKAAYLHCMVGADRTGFACLVIEGLLGVSIKECSIDYELTSLSVVGRRYRDGTGNVYYTNGLSYLKKIDGSTFKDKCYNYMVNTVKISKNDIEEFRNLLLE